MFFLLELFKFRPKKKFIICFPGTDFSEKEGGFLFLFFEYFTNKQVSE